MEIKRRIKRGLTAGNSVKYKLQYKVSYISFEDKALPSKYMQGSHASHIWRKTCICLSHVISLIMSIHIMLDLLSKVILMLP